MAAIINETTLKRIEELAEQSKLDVNDYINNILDENEKYNDPGYLEYLQGIDEAWEEYESGNYEVMTVEEFRDFL